MSLKKQRKELPHFLKYMYDIQNINQLAAAQCDSVALLNMLTIH